MSRTPGVGGYTHERAGEGLFAVTFAPTVEVLFSVMISLNGFSKNIFGEWETRKRWAGTYNQRWNQGEYAARFETRNGRRARKKYKQWGSMLLSSLTPQQAYFQAKKLSGRGYFTARNYGN